MHADSSPEGHNENASHEGHSAREEHREHREHAPRGGGRRGGFERGLDRGFDRSFERGERGERRGGHHRGGPGSHGGRGAARGGRGRRGDIRVALLIALQDGPAHGYELMQSLAEKSSGRWRPSPGSVYPTLQMLEDEGLLASVEAEGKRVFSLTEAGAAEAEARKLEAGEVMPWERDEDTSKSSSLRDAVALFELAARQAHLAGDEELITRVTAVINDARKAIYQLLAE